MSPEYPSSLNVPCKKFFKRIFQENKQDLRWSHFNKMTPADRMLEHVRDKAKKTICPQSWVYDMEAIFTLGKTCKKRLISIQIDFNRFKSVKIN